MPLGDDYRAKATQMYERARKEPNRFIRVEFENLALAYLRLAAQADRNGTTDLVYETPLGVSCALAIHRWWPSAGA